MIAPCCTEVNDCDRETTDLAVLHRLAPRHDRQFLSLAPAPTSNFPSKKKAARPFPAISKDLAFGVGTWRLAVRSPFTPRAPTESDNGFRSLPWHVSLPNVIGHHK